jgi:hypothetical protein
MLCFPVLIFKNIYIQVRNTTIFAKKDWLDVIDIYHVHIDWSTLACRNIFGSISQQ